MSLRCDLNVIRSRFVEVCLYLALASWAHELRAEYSAAEFDAVASPQEKKLNQIRDEEIQQLKMVMRRSMAKDQRADLLLRLGEVYNEKYRFYFFKENQIWNKKYEEAAKTNSKKKIKPDNEKSKRYLVDSIKYLEDILESIGQYDKLDEVYYYLGFNNWELGNKAKSANYFQRLVRNYPRSRYISEAHRYLADYQFASRQFKESLANYQAAARDSTAPTLPRILYGTAWSYFKVGKPKAALETMLNAIRKSKDISEEEAVKRGTSLQNDAYDALVLFYSEAGNPKEAQQFFEKEVGEQMAAELLAKLLAIYQRQGRYGEALTTSRQLENVDSSAKEEGSQQRFEILQNALKLAQQQRSPDRELGILKTMIAEYIQKDAKEEIQDAIKTTVRNSAIASHKESEKAQDRKQSEARAISLYKLYLGTFGKKADPKDIYEIHFYLADLYSQANKHREAASEYRLLLRAAMEDKGNDYLAKIQRNVAEGVIYSLDAYFKENKGGPQSKQEIDELLEAIDGFVQLYPADKDSPKFVARAAGLLKDDKSREAEYHQRLHLLIEKYPGTPQAFESAILLVRDAEKRENYAKVQELINGYLGNQRLMGQDNAGDFRKQLEAVLSKAKFKTVKDIADSSNFNEAAARYEQLAKESKDREVRFKATNNAAVNYGKANDTENELRLFKEIAKQFPEKSDAAERILGVADESFLLGKYADAAEKYEDYYNLMEPRLANASDKVQSLAVNALRNAAFLRDALNQEDEAGENIRRIVKAANQKLENARTAAEDFLYDRATRARKEGNTVEAVNAYRRYLSVFPAGRFAIESMVHLGNLYGVLREPEKAQGYLAKAAETTKAKAKGLSRSELGYAAQARLLLLDGLEDAYRRSTIELPEERLKRDVKMKLQRMEQLNKGYLQVVEYGDGKWALEAFYKMSQTYLDFAIQLENAPVPANYEGEDKVKFQNQLKAVAKPVRLKVLETLQTALRQGEQLVVGDPAMARIYLANALITPETGLPLVYDIDWSDPKRWIMGQSSTEQADRQALKANPKNLKALVAVGNAHLVRNEERFARIFYDRALRINSKYVPALNNLAYLEGKNGNVQAALAGFKQALQFQEFELQPKMNMAKIYMGSGLWRHAGLAYRQLEVRAGNDEEVLRGLGLSYLATGKFDKAREYLKGRLGSDQNARFAKAVIELASGDRDSARSEFSSLAKKSEFAQMIVEHWKR